MLKSGGEASSFLETLQSVESLVDLAPLLSYRPQALSFILYKIKEEDKYKIFKIPKRSGGFREICAPNEKLKTLQQHLSSFLQRCYKEYIYSIGRNRNPAHGFLPERSIGSNCKPHIKSEWILNIDIEDFFGSINFGRVRGFLMSKNGFALREPVATRIAQICCYKGLLPQGAPTSPVVSNLIGVYLDVLMQRLASRYRLRYTRYADDITLSLRKGDFPKEIAEFRCGKLFLGRGLIKCIEKSGFSINNKKSRLQRKDGRQAVTGLVANQRINVPSEFRKSVRAMVHSFILEKRIYVEGPTGRNYYEGVEAARRLGGYLGHIYWVDSLSNSESIKNTYREFLLYTRFFDIDEPVILCEGETDVIYFKEAMKGLYDEFPLLAEKTSNGIELKVEFYNFKNRRMNELLGLGGCPQLEKFLLDMNKMAKKFSSRSGSQPVIIIVDSDNAGRKVSKIYQKLEEKFKEYYGSGRFNVKLVEISNAAAGGDVVVEDLLPKALLDVQHDGRRYTNHEDFDGALFFGKTHLAKEVFLPNCRSLDYSGFVPTLEKVEACIPR